MDVMSASLCVVLSYQVGTRGPFPGGKAAEAWI